MDSQTKAEVIENALGGAAALMKEVFVRRQERQQMERQAQLQKEIEKIRAGVPEREQEEEVSSQSSRRDRSGEQDRRPSGEQQLVSPQAEGRDGVVSLLDKASDNVSQADRFLEQATEAEDCPLCQRLIRATRNKSTAEQRRLLPELRDFLAGVESDTPTEEVAAQVRESEMLLELLQEEMAGVM